MVTVALFTLLKLENQPWHSSIGMGKKTWFADTMELISAIKNGGLKQLKTMLLSKFRQSQKDTYCKCPLIYGS